MEDVRRWFQEALDGGPAGQLKKYRVRHALLRRIHCSWSLQRILVLTGLAGTAKTTTVRVLAKEMGFEISEWHNTLEEGNEDDYSAFLRIMLAMNFK